MTVRSPISLYLQDSIDHLGQRAPVRSEQQDACMVRSIPHCLESVEVATLAVSLGGTETLVQHPASMTHGSLTDEERATSGISDGLIRVSVGLEHVDDLIADFAQALKRAKVGAESRPRVFAVIRANGSHARGGRPR